MLRSILAMCSAIAFSIGTASAETLLERGSYLVNSIMACGNCHTPKDAVGEPIADKPDEIRREACAHGHYSAAIAALKEIGILTGLRVERRENGAAFEFSERTTEELLSELRELGYDVRDRGEDAPPRQAVN